MRPRLLVLTLLAACATSSGQKRLVADETGDSSDPGPDDSSDSSDTADTSSGDTDVPSGELLPAPASLPFGEVASTCTTDLDLVLRNISQGPIDLAQARVVGVDGTRFRATGPLPAVLDPKDEVTLTVSFTPGAIGTFDDALLELRGGDPLRTLTVVPLRGAGAGTTVAEDTFVEPPAPKVDVLLTLDQSGSMGPILAEISQGFGAVFTRFANTGIDYRVAATTTDGTAGCFDFFGPYISPATTDPASTLLAQTATIRTLCTGESAFDASLAALASPEGQAFLRADAKLAVFVISDEDEQSKAFPAPSPTIYTASLVALKGGDASSVTFHGFVGPRSGGLSDACPPLSKRLAYAAPRYHSAIAATGGVLGDLCNETAASFLDRATLAASGTRVSFPLAHTPSSTLAADFTVTVAGTPVTQDLLDGWTYVGADNAVELRGAASPGPGETIVVRYPYEADCP